MSQGQTHAATLCWACRNAVPSMETGDGCPWSQMGAPVDGWTAERRDLLMESGPRPPRRLSESYIVADCPLFQGDERPGKAAVLRKGGHRSVRTTNWDTARARALKDQGMSVTDIADMVGTTATAVRSYFSRVSADDKRLQQKLESVQYDCGATHAGCVEQIPAIGVHEVAELLSTIDRLYPGARLERASAQDLFFVLEISVRPQDGSEALNVTFRLK